MIMGVLCRLQFLCMALDLCGKLAYPIFVFNSFMRSEPLLCASNRQSDQHRFSFVNISDAVIEFDEIMADGEICIQMCCGFSFMVFWIEIIYMYENVTWWLAHFARINPLFYEVELPKKFFFRFRDSYREWAHWNALRMTRTHCSYLLSLSRMYKCDVYASCIWIMLFFLYFDAVFGYSKSKDRNSIPQNTLILCQKSSKSVSKWSAYRLFWSQP